MHESNVVGSNLVGVSSIRVRVTDQFRLCAESVQAKFAGTLCVS